MASTPIPRPLAGAEPLGGLLEDRAAAREAGDPNADLCWLATIVDGRPAVRTLVLREHEGALALFVSATSPKWRQLQAQPAFEITCWLPSLQRQWRVSGTTRALAAEVVAGSWHRRPRVSQVLDHVHAEVSAQSSVVTDAEHIDADLARLDRTLGEHPPVPASAAALALDADTMEVMQLAKPPALHRRVRWELTQGHHWQRSVLVP